MGLHSAGGHLEKAVRQLSIAWNQAQESWKDTKMSGFDDRYITAFQQDTRLAIETMARMASLIDRIRRDCSDREAY